MELVPHCCGNFEVCLACCLAAFHPTQPSTKHTLLPTAACCGFNRIDFNLFNVHIYVFKYISHLTVVIGQTEAAHLTLIRIHTARQSWAWGLPRLLTHIHGEKPPLVLWAPAMRGVSWQRRLRDRHEMPLPSKVQVTSAPKAAMVPHAVRARPGSSLITKLTRGPAGHEQTYRKNKLPKTHT